MGDVDQSNDTEESVTINFKPSFVLIAIDTHSSMFQIRKNINEDAATHPFKDALMACCEIADSLILSSSKSSYNKFGVVLADEDQKASLVEVEDNLLDSVKLLKEKSKLSNDKLKAQYQRSGDFDLGAFFLLCKRKFRNINSAYYKRTLIFITNNEDPCDGNAQKRFTALNEAKTFEACDIQFELISMKDDFTYSKFYNELFHLYSNPPTTEVVCQDKGGLVDKLESFIVYRYTKLRNRFYPFKDDYTRYLKVMKVNFIRKSKLYNTHKASLDGKLLKVVRPHLGVNNADPNPFSLGMGLGQQLKLSLKDKYDIYGNDLPLGFHLQYVSNRQLDVGVVVHRTSILVVDPKEDLNYFDQFWQYCVKNDKVLVCIKKYRHPSPIRYVELVPKFANNQRLFLIKDLPFCNEMKLPKILGTDPLPSYDVGEEERKAVCSLIESLSFDYDPKMFVDWWYASKKAYVKSKLLDEPMEEVEDKFENPSESIDEEIKYIAGQINEVFNLPHLDNKGKKRSATASSGSTRGRKSTKK